ncbi:TIGR01440 family protein [Brevibacillus brevis]|uniref:TIGR01440 family protein n=1 Tax=Brevibacillus brevis TaxID=1393 RepID=UPI001F402375|nr:TIGR01440 family protein [Brevibacillus brevis]UIO42154.1 TIGR01440 family protein [Brevibacillus brevis]
MDLSAIEKQISDIVEEVADMAELAAGQLMVIGCSTSEVLGEHIGKAGSQDVAKALYRGIQSVVRKRGFAVAFQCCEHLNRALVVEREVALRYGLEEVSVVPVPTAGGSMAAHAFTQFTDAAVVEEIRANAGIDIGHTLIGMHLKHVAVPVRPTQRLVGQAHVTAARTRPKLIGGPRAVYEKTPPNESCT